MNDSTSRKSALLQVGLMVFIIAATILLGFLMVPGSEEERDKLLADLGTTNHGRLLSPVRSIEPLELRRLDGTAWRIDEVAPKWRMLIPVPDTCREACREMIYTTRQVHIRLGDESHRLQRLYVTTGPRRGAEAEVALGEEHPYLKFLYTDAAVLTRWLADLGLEQPKASTPVILVDPRGDAMMAYDRSHDGGGMLGDLKHLLKFSSN